MTTCSLGINQTLYTVNWINTLEHVLALQTRYLTGKCQSIETKTFHVIAKCQLNSPHRLKSSLNLEDI